MREALNEWRADPTQLLQPLAESLRFELKQSQVLPNLHPVKELLFQTVYEQTPPLISSLCLI